MPPSTRLRAWVHKQTFSDGSPVKLALYHITAGRYGGRIGTYELPAPHESTGDKDTDGQIDALADLITRDAEHDSQSVSEGGQQSYAVVSLDANDNHVARFMYKAAPVHDNEGVSTDMPDNRGLIGQLMRHNENRERISNNAIGTMMSYMTRLVETLTEENERMQEERLQVMTITQKLLTEQHERDMRQEEHETRQKNLQELMGSVRLLLPAIATKLTGRQVDMGISPERETIKQLLVSMSDEQKMALQSILTPQQIVALTQLVEDPIQ